MSELGHERRFGPVPMTSGSPLTADIEQVSWAVEKSQKLTSTTASAAVKRIADAKSGPPSTARCVMSVVART